jgi:hypothetical protein
VKKRKCSFEECRKVAQIKVSVSTGWLGEFCFKHGAMIVISQIKRLTDKDIGIYIQRIKHEVPVHTIAPEARKSVHTPEDRKDKEWDW